MRDRSDQDWQELARREPYFAVLTDDRYRGDLSGDAREQFFASGEADVEALFTLLPLGFAPRSALDFGCGVGRLTRALAKRVERVHGVDVAPAMLELARQNVPSATFSSDLPDVEFDLIVSLLVFQHIPVARGLEYLRELLARLNGVAVIQFTFRRPGGRLRRIARWLRARLPLGPYMQMNEYSPDALRRVIADAGCSEPVILPRMYADIEGGIVLTTRGQARA